MVCPNCGAALENYDAFCPGCGKTIQKILLIGDATVIVIVHEFAHDSRGDGVRSIHRDLVEKLPIVSGDGKISRTLFAYALSVSSDGHVIIFAQSSRIRGICIRVERESG